MKDQVAELTRLRGQVADIQASVHQLFVDAPAGSRLEQALQDAEAQLRTARSDLGRARDAIGDKP